MSNEPPQLPGSSGPSGVAGMACADSGTGHHGRACPVDPRSPTAAYKGRPRSRRGLGRQSERPVVPRPGQGQHNLARGKGPHLHPAADGGGREGIAARLVPLMVSRTPLVVARPPGQGGLAPRMPAADGDRRAVCGQTARTVRRGGAGDRRTRGLVRHRQPKGAETDRLTLPSGTSALLYLITIGSWKLSVAGRGQDTEVVAPGTGQPNPEQPDMRGGRTLI